MTITRITAQWTGFRGAPGYSNFFFDGPLADDGSVEAAGLAVHDFFDAIKQAIPTGTSINVQGVADLVDETTGQISGVVDFSAPPQVSGGGTGGYSAATGAVVNWNSNDYVNGRRVRGRTFLVPCHSGSFDSNGDLTTVVLGVIRTAADDLVSAALIHPLCVWHRPVGGAGGSSHVVSSSTVPDLGAVLRSRRD